MSNKEKQDILIELTHSGISVQEGDAIADIDGKPVPEGNYHVTTATTFTLQD